MSMLRRLALLTAVFALWSAARVPPTHAASPGRWLSAAPLPFARLDGAATTGPDGRIYVLGGASRESNGSLVSQQLVERYDAATDAWVELAPMPTRRFALGAATGANGRIYAVGGESCDLASCRDLATAEAYDPATNTWATLPPMPTARRALAVTAGPDGRIYAIGGERFSTNDALATVEAYDPRTSRWTTLPDLPTPRGDLAAATGPDGRIYAIGGTHSGAVYDVRALPTVEAYDPVMRRWVAAPPLPVGRLGLATTVSDGRIYALGGATTVPCPPTEFHVTCYRPLTDEQVYTPALRAWSPIAAMPTPRWGVAATGGPDGRIYVIGGEVVPGPGESDVVQVYDPVPCRFVLGFAVLHDAIPDLVGNCLDDEQHNPVNGDGLQHATRGLLVWRKADNFAAFTDGYRTWVNGPSGLQERLNSKRFPWEPNPDGLPLVR